MDQRWRRNHDVQAVQSLRQQAAATPPHRPIPPLSDPNATFGYPASAPASATSLYGQTLDYLSAGDARQRLQPIGQPAFDVRDDLIAKLQQQVQALQAEHAHTLKHVRQTVSQQFDSEKAALQRRITQLEDATTSAEKSAQTRIDQHRAEIASLSQLASEGRLKNASLQQELENLAATAAAEQNELAKRSFHQVRLYQETATRKEEALDSLRSEFEKFRTDAAKNDVMYRRQKETLESTVAQLRSDHEAAELDCSQLEHLGDQHEFHRHQLQVDLESYIHRVADEQMLLMLASDELKEQLSTSEQRLAVETVEKQSLIQSISRLRQQIKNHDAHLFAKDQEIDATSKLAQDSQRQLETLRRENESLIGQNDLMRNQIRETSQATSELNRELSDLQKSHADAETALNNRNRQFKELQSTSRSSEANVMLRMSEAEHQFSLERERCEAQWDNERQSWIDQLEKLESEIEQLHQKLGQQTQQIEEQQRLVASAPQATTESKTHLSKTKQALEASSAENDRLQGTIDSLEDRLIQTSESAAIEHGKCQQALSQLEDAETELTANTQKLANSNLVLQQLRDQAAQYANSISLLQREIAEKDLLLQGVQQGHQSTKECERLSQELSRRIASHAQERDSLNQRIEQLRDETERLRSTQEQIQLNYEQFGTNQQQLHQPTESKKAA